MNADQRRVLEAITELFNRGIVPTPLAVSEEIGFSVPFVCQLVGELQELGELVLLPKGGAPS